MESFTVSRARRMLVIAYGNPGRGDDGLGPAVASVLAADPALAEVRFEVDYQLAVEHAALIAEAGAVVFIDAATEGAAPFTMVPVAAEADRTFSSHSASPGQLVGLAQDLFGAQPEAWLLAVRGYEFAPFTEVLSTDAAGNAAAATDFLRSWLAQRVQEFAAASAAGPREMPC